MSSNSSTYSVCGMCTVRCPIEVETENGEIKFISGNSHMGGINGALCARGAAGKALINDNERIQQPMIRVGDRGQGNWKPISWDEALDYAANQLKSVIDTYGARSVLFSDRGGPFRDLHQPLPAKAATARTTIRLLANHLMISSLPHYRRHPTRARRA